MSPADFCDGAISAICALKARCGYIFDPQECETLYQAGPFGCLQPIAQGERHGGLILDGAAAQRCFAFIATTQVCMQAEGAPWLTQPDCMAAIRGLQSAGDDCFTQYECQDTEFCDWSSTCPGICTPRSSAGQYATSSEACEAGLYRDANGICRSPVAPGGSCTHAAYAECTSGHFCDLSGVCVAHRPAGASCSPGDRCAAGLYCHPNQTCGPYGVIGGACRNHVGCMQDFICESSTPLGPGTCGLRRPAGGPCWVGYECAAGLECAGADQATLQVGHCIDPRYQAPPCSANADCPADRYCHGAGQSVNAASTDGHCWPLEPIGGYCTGAGDCVTGQCDDGLCAPAPICEDA